MIKKAKTACFNSGHRIEDHFGEITQMVPIITCPFSLRRISLCIGDCPGV
jgi:hypothetical protein